MLSLLLVFLLLPLLDLLLLRLMLPLHILELLLMLLLARIDGKSPVEYLTEPKQDFVRGFVSSRVSTPTFTQEVVRDWFEGLQTRMGK